MENKSCEVIRDLIPLYVDGVCSTETGRLLEEHMNECEECRKLYESMKMDFMMPENHEQRQEDANIVKRVKRRIWVERITIAVLALLVVGIVMFVLTLKLTVSHKNMNDVINLDEIYVEEDNSGNLWLVRSGNATMASVIFPEVYTKDGKLVFSYSQSLQGEIEENQTYHMKVVFFESPLQYEIQKFMNMDMGNIKEERSMLVSKESLEQYEEIVIEQSDGTKKVLWERE